MLTFLLITAVIMITLSITSFLIATREIKLSPNVALSSIPLLTFAFIGWLLLGLALVCAIHSLGFISGSLLVLVVFCTTGGIITLPSRFNGRHFGA
ncbi:hypothetical protein [Algibacillus agarilyticus]|uniref:hypothetical protein n=1 Tax=Algibacillus agarilyticus TaxID=2234133 RepID=UPI000DD03E17|nr:hypothetical protein [Algibacillus agarilyticus]